MLFAISDYAHFTDGILVENQYVPQEFAYLVYNGQASAKEACVVGTIFKNRYDFETAKEGFKNFCRDLISEDGFFDPRLVELQLRLNT